MKQKYVKSPLNYTGNKFKLLNKIIPLFPTNINTFVDVFGGSLTVGGNVCADKIVYNEYDTNVYNIIKYICGTPLQIVEEEYAEVVLENNLSKENKESYLALRDKWNNTKYNIPELIALINYSFCYMVRFNSKGGFNTPFGNRSNPTFLDKVRDFQENLAEKKVYFYNKSFEELLSNTKVNNDYFFYLDPPYLITTANYNEKGGWNEDKENLLLGHLDKLNEQGIKFALSNVLEHKGKENAILKEWCKKYNVHYLEHKYTGYQLHGKNEDETVEVLITNY